MLAQRCAATHVIICLMLHLRCMGKVVSLADAPLAPTRNDDNLKGASQSAANQRNGTMQQVLVHDDGSMQMLSVAPHGEDHKILSQPQAHSNVRMRSEVIDPPKPSGGEVMGINPLGSHLLAENWRAFSTSQPDPGGHWNLMRQLLHSKKQNAHALFEYLVVTGKPYLPAVGSVPQMLMMTAAVAQGRAPLQLAPIIQAAICKFRGKLDNSTHLLAGSIPARHSDTAQIGASLLDVGNLAHDSTRKILSDSQWAQTETNLQETMMELVLHFLTLASFGLLYLQNVVNKRPKAISLFEFEAKKRGEKAMKDDEIGEDFNFSLFGCFKDLHYLGHSCCCPHIRAADTLAAAGILSFEAGFMLYMVIFLVAHFGPAFHLIATFFIAIPVASNRRKLREKFGGRERHGVVDYMASLCCWTCVVCQEARHVDEMTHTRVKCCCKFEFYGDPFEAIVGPAVHIDTNRPKSVLWALRTTSGHVQRGSTEETHLHAASGPTEQHPTAEEHPAAEVHPEHPRRKETAQSDVTLDWSVRASKERQESGRLAQEWRRLAQEWRSRNVR